MKDTTLDIQLGLGPFRWGDTKAKIREYAPGAPYEVNEEVMASKKMFAVTDLVRLPSGLAPTVFIEPKTEDSQALYVLVSEVTGHALEDHDWASLSAWIEAAGGPALAPQQPATRRWRSGALDFELETSSESFSLLVLHEGEAPNGADDDGEDDYDLEDDA